MNNKPEIVNPVKHFQRIMCVTKILQMDFQYKSSRSLGIILSCTPHLSKEFFVRIYNSHEFHVVMDKRKKWRIKKIPYRKLNSRAIDLERQKQPWVILYCPDFREIPLILPNRQAEAMFARPQKILSVGLAVSSTPNSKRKAFDILLADVSIGTTRWPIW